MQNITDIKSRIKSVKETRQITKAMELISVSKLRRAQERYASNLRYFKGLVAAIKDIMHHAPEIQNKYLQESKGNRCAFIVISGDKGLAGGYNHNVLALAKQKIMECDERYIITIGRTAVDFFTRNEIEIDLEYMYIGHNPSLKTAREIAFDLIKLFNDGIIDRTEIIFTDIDEFDVQTAITLQLLPIKELNYNFEADSRKPIPQILFDPNAEDVLSELVVQYIVGLIYTVLLHSQVSEHRSRMIAMSSATKSADEILEGLRLQYNRARQESITNELLEIVSGSVTRK